jgi:peptidoglycan/LPS O-acetylase OafA/YrhL
MTTEKLAYLDGWRGLAILCVLIAHFGPPIPVDLGRFGVDLFFVLSGLLMSRILFEQKTPLGLFYRRRISRVIPALLLFVAVMVAAWGTTAKELVGVLTFTRTYMTPGVWESVTPVQHLWSLNVEEHCYVLLALIASMSLLRRHAGIALLLLSLMTLVAVRLHQHLSLDPDAGYLLNTECAATGLLASAAIRSLGLKVPYAPALLLTALACYSGPWWASVTIAPFLLALAVNNVGSLRKPLEWRWLGLLGLVSYSVYLWQQPFYKHPLPYHIGLPCALLIGAASFYFFESPVRQWLNEHWKSADLKHSHAAM